MSMSLFPARTKQSNSKICSRTYGHGFVPEEIDGLIAVIFHVSQAVPLVPAIRKDIDADLAS